jgi:hypothetical protein
LHHRLTGQDIYFRAFLTTGSFSHYPLQHIECFFGEALVNAYLREKEIPSIGLFIDDRCNKFNQYFRTTQFDNQYHFVYLNRSLESLEQYTAGKYPFRDKAIEDHAPNVPWQVRFLQDVHHNMRNHPIPSVRTKFLTAWDFYAKRYPGLTQTLSQQAFTLASLGGPGAWSSEAKEMDKSIKHYKRIGSGTPLSRQLSGRP